jgi:hypothetical protein
MDFIQSMPSFMIGDETQYSDFILAGMERTCLSKGMSLCKKSHLILEKHCYFADSDMRSYWRKQIEFLNEPSRFIAIRVTYFLFVAKLYREYPC